jgi:TonB family protein
VRLLRPVFLLLGLIALATAAKAQDAITVDKRTLMQHIDHHVFPAYPLKAKEAHIQGTVDFEIRVGPAGTIESMNVTSGPEMLRQAAIDCLKQWTYHPFLKDGVPVSAVGPVSLIFVLSDESNTTIGHGPRAPVQGPTVTVEVKSGEPFTPANPELEKQFDKADGECKNGILSRQFNDSTVASCKQAALSAEQLPMDGYEVAKRSAFVYAATAYADMGNFREALPWATRAVEIVKLGKDDNSGSNAAYSTKGTVEGLLGDLEAADHDLTIAEDFSRKGIVWVEKEAPSLRQQYARTFVRDLRFHAQVLRSLNRPDDAQKKLDEAARYE